MTDELSAQLSPAQTDVRDELVADLEWLLANKSGRHLVMWMLEQAGLYSTPYAIEPGLTEVNIGRGDMGRRLLAKLEDVSPTAYPQLMLDRARDKFEREKVTILDDDDDDLHGDDRAP